MWKAFVKSLARGLVASILEQAVSDLKAEIAVTKGLSPKEQKLVSQGIDLLQERVSAKLQ